MPPTALPKSPDASREAVILIHDWHADAHDDTAYPRAEVIFGRNEQHQEIDIIATVRANAASIGHPAILFAIERWEHFVISQINLPGLGRQPLDEGSRYRHESFPTRVPRLTHFAKIAEAHLENIGKILAEGARQRAWPKELAFKVDKEQYDESVRYLELVFEAWEQSRCRNVSTLIERAKDRLREKGFIDDERPSGASHTPIPPEDFDRIFGLGFKDVRDFLETSGRKLFAKRRSRRAGWVNEFNTWRFDQITPGTRRAYEAVAKKPENPPRQDASDSLSPMENYRTVTGTPAAFNLPIVSPERRKSRRRQ